MLCTHSCVGSITEFSSLLLLDLQNIVSFTLLNAILDKRPSIMCICCKLMDFNASFDHVLQFLFYFIWCHCLLNMLVVKQLFHVFDSWLATNCYRLRTKRKSLPPLKALILALKHIAFILLLNILITIPSFLMTLLSLLVFLNN